MNVPADMVHYGVTKAGMLALGNGLAKLTRGTEVTVNTILGGPTYSDGVAAAVARIADAQAMEPADLKAAIIGGNPTSLLQRFIEPEEIANLALYLASPLSSATNGAALRADGGVLTTLDVRDVDRVGRARGRAATEGTVAAHRSRTDGPSRIVLV